MGGQIGEMKVRMEEDGFVEKEEMPKKGGKMVKEKKGEEEKPELEWYEFPLPKPPIPELGHTLARYLEYASVLAKTYALDLERTKKYVKKFEENIAHKLQQKLVELAEKEQNWINHFWLPEMYLRQRIPLPLNFNPAYIFPRKHFLIERDQIDYAAWLVRGFLDFKMRVDRKQIPRETVPDRFSGLGNVQMCMDQYERILNNYRQPGEEEDILMDRRICENCFEKNGTMNGDLRREEHILVLSHSQAFVLFTRLDDRPIPAPKIAENLAKIRQMSKNRSPVAVVPLAAASTGQRGRAAQFWAEIVKECVNQCSLDWVRTSVFVLCLDENENEESDYEKLTNQEKDGLQMLHGFGSKKNGLNRWFDATIQLIVSANGCCGMCIEHSVAEGIVYIKMTEEVIGFANENWAKRHHQKQQKEDYEYNLKLIAPEPMLLKWTITKNALNMLEAQITEFDQMVNDLQLRVLEFTGFGKNAIKKWRISPDGFVQLSMQLAHFKLHGYLVSSYESATMRRFCFGRVDNIRAATPEALEWVKAMGYKEQKREEQRALFVNAADKQALTTRENVTGHGIDNHLCALEVLSRQYDDADEETEMFREPMWSEMMRFPLSTSQVTTSNSAEFHDCYLCYGPVVRDGYGCAYNIHPDRIIFAISSWKLDSRTNCDDFREKIRESLEEMQQLLEK